MNRRIWFLAVMLALLAGMLAACTRVSYGEFSIVSVMQKRYLNIAVNDDGAVLQYGSGSDPVAVEAPMYGSIGKQGQSAPPNQMLLPGLMDAGGGLMLTPDGRLIKR